MVQTRAQSKVSGQAPLLLFTPGPRRVPMPRNPPAPAVEGVVEPTALAATEPVVSAPPSEPTHWDTLVAACEHCTEEKNCPKHTFDIMGLPTELRLMIFEAALKRGEAVDLSLCPTKDLKREEKTESPRSAAADRAATSTSEEASKNQEAQAPEEDDLNLALLRLSKTTHAETLKILYKSNIFTLTTSPLLTTHPSSTTLLPTLSQRSRSLLKHCILPLPQLRDLESLTRTGLRYCRNLQVLEISAPAGELSRTWIPRSWDLLIWLRWMPRGAKLVVTGRVEGDAGGLDGSEREKLEGRGRELDKAVRMHNEAAGGLSESEWIRRQAATNEVVTGGLWGWRDRYGDA